MIPPRTAVPRVMAIKTLWASPDPQREAQARAPAVRSMRVRAERAPVGVAAQVREGSAEAVEVELREPEAWRQRR